MKKASGVYLALLLAVPFFVGAVTWNGDSNQFRWAGTGVKNDRFAKASEVALHCVPDFAKGTVTISYKLPAAVKTAKLVVYSVNGAHVQSFDLQAGSTAVRWDYAKSGAAAGIYVASLRFGDVEHNIQLSLVK